MYHKSDNLLPSQLPEVRTGVSVDWETSGLYGDDGARISCVGVAWYEGDLIRAEAFPFRQGLYGKPEAETARLGWLEGREIIGYYKNDSAKTGAKAGDPKYRKTRRRLTPEEVLEPDPNLGPAEWDALMAWLLRHDLCAHNAMFEVVMGDYGAGPEMPGVDLLDNVTWCTMLGQSILDPEHPRGLKPTADRLFGESPDEETVLLDHLKERGLPHRRYDLADWSVIRPYVISDVVKGLRLARLQYYRFRGHEARRKRLDECMEELDVLVKMERRGLPYNVERSLEWAAKLDAKIAEMEPAFPFRPTNPGAASFFFTDGETDRGAKCLGLEPLKWTSPKPPAEPQPSLDAEVLEQLAAQDSPHAQRFREFRLLSDATSRYYRGYAMAAAPDGRIRMRYKQVGTATGRCSCERINLLAIPHDHRMLAAGSEILAEAPSPRELIEAPEGFELWHMDLAQAELRVAAEYARCEGMLGLINQGKDLHGVTAVGLGLASGPEAPNWYKARSVIGKRSNFSLIFGIGHVSFRKDLRKTSGVDLEDGRHICVTGKRGCKPMGCRAKKLVEDWHKLYPEFRPVIDAHMRVAEREHRTWVRDDIYRHYTDVEIAYHDFHKAFNNRVQNNIGLFTKRWMVLAERRLERENLPAHAGLLLQIHDALLVMLPVGMRELAEELAQIGRDLWKQWFSVPGGVDLEPWKKKVAA